MEEVTSLVSSIADASRCLSNCLEEHRRQGNKRQDGVSMGSITASLERTDGSISDCTISASIEDEIGDLSISASSLSAHCVCPSPQLPPTLIPTRKYQQQLPQQQQSHPDSPRIHLPQATTNPVVSTTYLHLILVWLDNVCGFIRLSISLHFLPGYRRSTARHRPLCHAALGNVLSPLGRTASD